jgi:5-methylcytosine-specific restriction protein B
MNQKISVLYDREHTIGHSYFLPLRNEPTIEKLAQIFEDNIIPLLQEYFYDDYAKIRLVLGDNKKEKEKQFIKQDEISKALFGNTELDLDDSVLYEINPSAFLQADAYRSILIAQDTPTTSTLSD